MKQFQYSTCAALHVLSIAQNGCCSFLDIREKTFVIGGAGANGGLCFTGLVHH